ncbi:unnamed protein product [Symbiodinium necroappetens]|uniref:Uncharacterized protein n=1 Tax=Symbiodinium necroappetens TaxID=1628268 RepID=A0A812JEE5_9DINO|nr:unnamed protein product [Symbiodinium necroappetens]
MPFQHYRTTWQMSNAGVVEQILDGAKTSIRTTSTLRRWRTWLSTMSGSTGTRQSSRNRLRWHVNRCVFQYLSYPPKHIGPSASRRELCNVLREGKVTLASAEFPHNVSLRAKII